MNWQGVRDKEGKMLFSERDMFDYIEEQCGWQVMNEVKNAFERLEDLEERNQELEELVDDSDYDY